MILPGIGAFLAHKVPAAYNAKEQIFMPPHRELGFNPNIMVNDALLLSEYVSVDKITYDKAEKALSRDISSLRRILSSKGICCFGELGTFHMNINGAISFVPNENAIDEMLANIAFRGNMEFQSDVLDVGAPQRNMGLFFAIASIMFLGTAIFS